MVQGAARIALPGPHGAAAACSSDRPRRRAGRWSPRPAAPPTTTTCRQGAALASYMEASLRARQWTSVGVSWGQTLQSAIERLPRQVHPDLEIVSMIGGASTGASFNSFGHRVGIRRAARVEVFAARRADLPARRRRPRALPVAAGLSRASRASAATLDAAVLVGGRHLAALLPDRERAARGVPCRGSRGDRRGRRRARPLPRRGRERRSAVRLAERTVGVELDVLQSIPETHPRGRRPAQGPHHPRRRPPRARRHAHHRRRDGASC